MMMVADRQIIGRNWPHAQKNHTVVCDILSRFFKHVMPLPVYLARIFPSSDAEQIQNIFSAGSNYTGDTSSKLSNLQNAVIACNLDQLPHFPNPNLTSKTKKDQEWLYETLKEIIFRAQATILRNQETTFSSNMLTLGYRKADDRSTVMKMVGNICISNIHVNACVTQILMGHEWFILLGAIGEVAMEHILTHTALFVPLNAPAQSNLVQVLGQSIGELKELSLSSMEAELERSKKEDNRLSIHRSRKRKRHSQKASEQSIKRLENDSLSQLQRKPSEVDLLRNRIFYAKLSRTRMGGVVKGLPINHVLQRMYSEKLLQRQSSKLETPDQHALLEARARLLCKHIWPREYGLKNVFCNKNAQNGTQQEFELRMALSSREEEIRIHGKIRTPERLLNCKQLLKLMILKHDRFDYRRALELCCPTSLPKRNLTRAERDQLVEELSESVVTGKADTQKDHSTDVETQFETQCHSISMNSEEEDFDHNEPELINKKTEKPRYTKYKTPHGCVARFIRYVLRSIVPTELFGSQHNRDIVFKACDEFVGLRRYESINLHQISQGFRILDCEWLLPRDTVGRNQRPTKEESMKRQNLANELLFWLFDSIIMPLLRTNFYATESAKFRNHVLYFRADVWDKITEPIIENLKDEKFQKIGKHKAVGIMSRRAFGYSFVRLLPKEVGMRPIMNLRRRSTKIDRNMSAANRSSSKVFQRKKNNNDEWGQLVVSSYSINNIMNATFQVLNFERQDNPNPLGSSVFGPHDVFVRLSSFKAQLQRRYGQRLPPLYFVKMDVAGAFDCIDQTTLLKIVDGIVRHDRYIVQRYNKLTSSNGQPFRTWPKIACAEEEHEPFQILAQHLAQMQAWRNTILADSISYTQCDRKSLVWLLNEHINNNLIKVGKDFCRQRVGIPQGSTLSTLLCCYYLAKMESDLQLTGSSEEHTRDSLLMRYTDDFLFISPNKELARRFFTSVHQVSADFNCSIAAEKTECNFKMYDASMESNLAAAALAVQVRSDSSQNGEEDMSFPWCSYRINTESLSVRYDLDRYKNTCVADSLTVPNRKPFKYLLSNMIAQSVQRQNLPIYLDITLNSIEGVLRNIHQMYLVATIKFVSAYQELIKRDKTNKSKIRGDKFIHDSILINIEHAFAHACAKMNQIRLQEQQQSSGNVSAQWKISLVTYRWMALHSIISILEMRPSTRKMNITQSLRGEMRKATFQIRKQVRLMNSEQSPLLNETFLLQQTSKSFKQARPILRSLKMQR